MPDINMQVFEEAKRNQLVTEVDIQTQVALNDYQVQLSDIANPTKSQDNVVIDRFGEFLPHWNESLDFDTWVKMSMEVAGKRLLMLHGNLNVSSKSSISDTWIFGDDFEDNDISDWNTGDFEGHIGTKCAISGGEVGGVGTSEAWMKKSIGETLTDYTLLWRTKTGASQWTSIQIGVDSSDTYYAHALQDNQDDFEIGYTERAALGASNPVQYLDWGVSNSVYYTFMVQHLVDGSFKVFKDGIDITSSLDVNNTDSTVQTITDIAIGCRYGADVVDFVGLGKYTSIEPTWAADDTPKNIATALKSLGRAG